MLATNATGAKVCSSDAMSVLRRVGTATTHKTVALAEKAMHKKAAKRPTLAVAQNPRSGNAIHGSAGAVGGAKAKVGNSPCLDVRPAPANLGVQAVALAAVQPQDPAILGHQEAGRMPAGLHEDVMRPRE